MSTKLKLGLLALLLGLPALLWLGRKPLTRLFPIEHEGVVMRIATFNKGGMRSKSENTHQLTQFAIIFEDGFDCEGSDTSFAAVREGDRIQMRGYHDVRGWPVMNPEWWECDEAQLDKLLEGR